MATDDNTAVRALAQAYYDTMVAGDEAGMRAVSDARAPIVGNFEGALLWQDLDAFITEATPTMEHVVVLEPCNASSVP